MDLTPWKLGFKPSWDKFFKKFDKQTQKQVLKKFEKMKQPLQARGLHSSRYQVEEVGQNRIAFIQYDKTRTKDIYFVGNHKQYEKWFKSQ
ncbi:MAG: hypothetical protein ABH821_01820 [archaeon]